MIRDQLSQRMKEAMRAKATVELSTIRLIMAALKDRDIAARSKGNDQGIADGEIMSMLQTMVRQREESVTLYEESGHIELAEREKEEITVLQSFLPKPLNDDEVENAINAAIEMLGAEGLRDMGKVMNHIKEQYPGRINPSSLGPLVKSKLQ